MGRFGPGVDTFWTLAPEPPRSPKKRPRRPAIGGRRPGWLSWWPRWPLARAAKVRDKGELKRLGLCAELMFFLMLASLAG